MLFRITIVSAFDPQWASRPIYSYQVAFPFINCYFLVIILPTLLYAVLTADIILLERRKMFAVFVIEDPAERAPIIMTLSKSVHASPSERTTDASNIWDFHWETACFLSIVASWQTSVPCAQLFCYCWMWHTFSKMLVLFFPPSVGMIYFHWDVKPDERWKSVEEFIFDYLIRIKFPLHKTIV